MKCAYKVHTALGPGLLEYTYQKCLAYELKKAGLSVKEEVSVPITYDDLTIENAYRIDILVNERLILELKVVDKILDRHLAQLNTYIKMSGYPYGILLNFSERSLKNGIKRVVKKGFRPDETTFKL